MTVHPTDAYRDLNIDMAGRKPADVNDNEIKGAFKKINDAFQAKRQVYLTKQKELHPDYLATSEMVTGLTPEAKEKFLKNAEDELKKLNTKHDGHKRDFFKAKEAHKILTNNETRQIHDTNYRIFNGSKVGETGFGFNSGRNSGGFAGAWSGGQTHEQAGAGRKTGAGAGKKAGSGFEGFDWRAKANESFHADVTAHVARARAAGVKPNLGKFHFSFKSLDGLDLAECSFGHESTFFDTDFGNANLKGATFNGARISGCRFGETVSLDGADFSHATFFDAKGWPSVCENVKFDSAHFVNDGLGDLSGRTFKNCSFKRTDFGFSSINGTTFVGGSFQPVRNSFHSFENVVFKDVDFAGGDLTRSTLRNVRFEGSLKGLTLSDSQLKSVDLSKANTAGLKVVDFLGREIKNPFKQKMNEPAGKPTSGTQGRTSGAEARAAGAEAGTAAQGVEDILQDAKPSTIGKFVDRCIRTEGELSHGKIGLIGAGVLAAGAGAYYLSQRNAKPPQQTWSGKIESEAKDGPTPSGQGL